MEQRPIDFQFPDDFDPRLFYSESSHDSPASLPLAFQNFSFDSISTSGASPNLNANADLAGSFSLDGSPHHEPLEGATHNRHRFASTSQGVFTPRSLNTFEVTGVGPSPLSYHDSLLATQRSYSPSPRSMSLPEGNASTSQALNQSGSFLPPPKQLRFVNSDGQPHTKRRRINAACLTCRKRKTRCSGEHPRCKTCTDNGHACAGYADKQAQVRRNGPGADEDDDEGAEEDDDDGRPSAKRSTQQNTSAPGRSATSSAIPAAPHNETQSTPVLRDDLASPGSSHTAGSSSASRHRVPFFRYFGPTAIVPGFKQMVVQIKERDHRRSALSISSESPAPGNLPDGVGPDFESSPGDLTFYDASDTAPTPAMVIQLCEVFFTHLGCNYPFLQRERFMKDLREKKVDAILVDAVCAIAARFSSDPSLSRTNDDSIPADAGGKIKRAFKGQPFAQRAATALVDTFGHPTLAVAQACLLLAYEEFGTDRDSGLWMFLGTSIRMAQDLGIQKLEGMQLEGRMGPTPKTVKISSSEGAREEKKREAQQEMLTKALLESQDEHIDDRRASEAERIDSFWSIFFLDRAVSSGVGRPVTLRDKDVEISFPYRPDEKMINGFPHPFPVMMRIVHLYGRIADVINNIQGGSEVNADGLKRLTAFEKDLTGIYQKMSTKLHFNATNFQHYVKAGQGTNFILLHFWFHTSIILLHQPTLMYTLDSRVQQLFEDSRDLSLSSAKTIADIIAFAELIDVGSFIGNPFTSQPMYVAACAFLAEARAHASEPNSRQTSPPQSNKLGTQALPKVPDPKPITDSKVVAKHTLLASAANQNYQRCYKALQLLNSYWAGCRYILTALDQKSKGLLDPILYTREDIDGEMPSIEPSFTQPGWRKSAHASRAAEQRATVPWSPRMDWSQAIGWSLTGTTNSPAPNLSFLYPNHNTEGEKAAHIDPQTKPQPARPQVSRERSYHPVSVPGEQNPNFTMPPPQIRNPGELPYDPVSTADADLLLGLHSPYSVGSNSMNPPVQTSTSFDFTANAQRPNIQYQSSAYYTPSPGSLNTPGFSDMLIESQDIDMSQQFVGQNGFDHGFPGGDMIWLEYLPQDVLNYFNHNGDAIQSNGGHDDHSGTVLPSGPGPPSG